MFSKFFFKKKNNAKITPVEKEAASSSSFEEEEEEEKLKMRVVSLRSIMKMYGGQRHPKVESYDVLKSRGELKEYRYVPPDSTTIYISHEWVGTDHPDPDGTQMYHLLLMLERLQKGEISRTNMLWLHSLIFKQTFSTTSEEWKRVLDPEKTYIWYDGFCVPKSRREDGFRSIPSYIQRCDFMIILAPGCTHFDRIDPRTKRKMNLCYRTYRLRARCVFELFSSFLTTKGKEQARPALLVRSGTGIPNWNSCIEVWKILVGTSLFECCELNHTTIECRRPLYLVNIESMIKKRARSLFVSNDYAEARSTLCIREYWCKGLKNHEVQFFNSLDDFREMLRWDARDNDFIDREGFPLLVYASFTNSSRVVQELLIKIKNIKDLAKRQQIMRAQVPKRGLPNFGVTGHFTPLMAAMATSEPEIVSLLLEHGANPLQNDTAKNDAFIFAAFTGRLNNIKFWLSKFPDWNLEKENNMGIVRLRHTHTHAHTHTHTYNSSGTSYSQYYVWASTSPTRQVSSRSRRIDKVFHQFGRISSYKCMH